MSAHAQPTAHASKPAKSHFHLLVGVAMLMAAIIGLEIVAAHLPFSRSAVRGLVLSLMALQFLCAIFFLMHLKWEKPFCTILFFIGIGLTGATVAALLGLFGADASVPLTSKDVGALPPPLAVRSVG
jgi:cytochrome c oxidase subunit 4